MEEFIVSFLLLILSAILLAINFVFTKLFQLKEGTQFSTGMYFNAIIGISTAVVFFALNKFTFNLTLFSFVMALLQTTAIVSYTLIGFRIMAKENVSDYTFFLMTGGMIVPYIWGVVFLKEKITIFNILGLLLITVAVLLINGNSKKTLKLKIMCGGIFLLNGIVSVTSKLHQINPKGISSTEFVILTSAIKGIICLIIFLFSCKKSKPKNIRINILLVIVLAAISNGISYFLQLNGASSLPATIVYPVVTGGTIIFTGIAGMICFKEKITKKVAFGMGLCLIGTCFFL